MINKCKSNIFYFIAFFHCLLTFFTDSIVFTGSRRENIIVYIFLKIILFIILSIFWYFVLGKNKKTHKIFLYSIPYLLILLTKFFMDHDMYLVGDELNIFNYVTNFNIYPAHFTYITGIVYAVSLMIIPFQAGIVVIKIFLQSILCGYCVYKFKSYYKSKWSYLIYLLFIIPTVIDNGILIHRMQYYGLLYLFTIIKVVFDYRTNQKLQKKQLFLLMLSFAILAIWRKEGIYLLVFAPLIICSVYKIQTVRNIGKTFISFIIILLLVVFPQMLNSTQSFTEEDTHTYNHWFVNMCREGLDKSKYPEQMKIIDKYISLDAVDYINRELGDSNYEDEYIAWREGYIGIRDNYTKENVSDYKGAVKYLVINEPIIFLKTRIGTWIYSSKLYEIYSLKISLVYNLNIPILALGILFMYSIVKKKYAYLFISSGLLLNTIITLLFAPASYFKYYYHSYLIGIFFIIMFVVQTLIKLSIKIKYNKGRKIKLIS